jgi:hypothetical protein
MGRRQPNYRYATSQMSGDEVIAASRALDENLDRLMPEKSKHEDF